MTECSKNKSGKDFEDAFQKKMHENGIHVKKYNNSNCLVCGKDAGKNTVICQFPLLDAAGIKSKVDFYYKNPSTGKEVYIECKNQRISGSVDQKLYYYYCQMLWGFYKNGSFVLYVNDDYKGNSKIIKLFSTLMEPFNSYVIREKNIDELFKLMNNV